MIDFQGDQTDLLLNPLLPPAERQRLQRIMEEMPKLPAHVWLGTSGSGGSLKLVALSKQALRASAMAVNAFLEIDRNDVWCCVLPVFHVGGLGIYARAHWSGSRVVSAPWEPHRFVALCEEEGVSRASLVPTQLRDLLAMQARAPRTLRSCLVGGGALEEAAYAHALDLGWPVLPTYGMTETSSQVATARIGSPALHILPHAEIREELDQRLAIRSEALLTGYGVEASEGARFIDPKVEGWFLSDDLGEVQGGILKVIGRGGDFIKIGGESVDLGRLQAILDSLRGDLDAAVISVPDQRLGRVIHLACTSQSADGLIREFNARVLPFERIRGLRFVPSIPRTPLGKLMRTQLETDWR